MLFNDIHFSKENLPINFVNDDKLTLVKFEQPENANCEILTMLGKEISSNEEQSQKEFRPIRIAFERSITLNDLHPSKAPSSTKSTSGDATSINELHLMKV